MMNDVICCVLFHLLVYYIGYNSYTKYITMIVIIYSCALMTDDIFNMCIRVHTLKKRHRSQAQQMTTTDKKLVFLIL